MFPPAQWLPAYQPQWLAHDAIAGVTLAAYGIPVSLAYASLAGLPPQHGIYCYLLGGLFYALFGSSRQLAIGPDLGDLDARRRHGRRHGRRAIRRAGRHRRADRAGRRGHVRAGVAAAAELAGQLHQRDDPARLQGRRGAARSR